MSFKFRDYVIHDSGYKQEIGRVTSCGEKIAFVCYNFGCSAACTPLKFLRPATRAEIVKAPAGIGYHRFDGTCPDWLEECCSGCDAKAVES